MRKMKIKETMGWRYLAAVAISLLPNLAASVNVIVGYLVGNLTLEMKTSFSYGFRNT